MPFKLVVLDDIWKKRRENKVCNMSAREKKPPVGREGMIADKKMGRLLSDWNSHVAEDEICATQGNKLSCKVDGEINKTIPESNLTGKRRPASCNWTENGSKRFQRAVDGLDESVEERLAVLEFAIEAREELCQYQIEELDYLVQQANSEEDKKPAAI